MNDHIDSGPGSGGRTATAAPPPPPPPVAGAVSSPTPGPGGRGGRSGRVGLGIALIIAGMLFFAGRVFPMVNLLNLWPLIMIAAGLANAFTPGRDGWSAPKMFDGFVTVAFGAVLLTNTLGYVGWGVWARIIEFWPVLLIALGVDLLSKALDASWLRVVGSLAVIAALAYATATYSGATGRVSWDVPTPGGETVDVSEPVLNTKEAKLTLDGGVAEIDVASGDDLVGITGTSPWGVPSIDVRRTGSLASVAAKLGDESPDTRWPRSTSAEFDVSLSDSVLWDIRMNTGVSAVKADFGDVLVRNFDLRPGVADCDIRLGEVPPGIEEGNVQVRSGVSAVTLRIPEGTQGRVQIESGLSGTNVRGGFEEAGRGVWETEGFDEARAAGDPVWMIIVHSGVGTITIDTY